MWVGVVIRDYETGQEIGKVLRTNNRHGSHRDTALIKQTFREVTEAWHETQEEKRGPQIRQDSSSGEDAGFSGQ